ncbi:MAG: sensor histidine kinase [Saprospiraceae bacterium]
MARAAIPVLCRKRALAWLLAAAFAIPGRAQTDRSGDYHVDIQQIDGRYGLESKIVRTIYQDRKGFIWISTPGGLARFNGYELLYFKDPRFIGKINTGIDIIGDMDDKLIIAENRIHHIYRPIGQSLKERMVVYLLHPESGRVLPFSSSIGRNAPFKKQDISTLSFYNETLYTGLGDGRIYSFTKGKWALFYRDPSQAPIRSLSVGAPGKHSWVIAKDTLSRISPEGRCLEREYVNLSGSFWYVVQDRNGNAWINRIQPGYGGTVFYKAAVFSKAPGKPLQNTHPIYGDLSNVQTINFDKAGRAWLWKGNTFHVLDLEGQKIAEIPAQGSTYNFPKIYFDARNRAWISQRQEFVTVRIAKKRFERYLGNKSMSIRQMAEVQPGVIWAATYDGLFEFSPQRPTIKKIALPTEYLFGLCKHGPYVWIGIHGDYVLRVDSRNGTWEKWPVTGLDNAKQASLHLLNPFVDNKGNVWIGSNMGLFKWDTLRHRVYHDPRFNTHGLGQREVNYLAQNEEGIWVGTNQGLYLLDPDQGVKKTFPELAQYSISYILEKPNGVAWIATRGQGLLRWERDRRRITVFGPAEGIINPTLHAVFEDKKGRFWMPSDRGLVYFDPNTLAVHVFYESDGLSHDEFNRRSYLKLSDGSFLFGGISGINRLRPNDFDEFDRSSPFLHITHYDVWDPSQRKFVSKTTQLIRHKKISLNARQISFQIKFALLGYDKLGENRYAYKLEGMDKDWIQIRENFLRFTSLPYGKFTLRIKGAPAEEGWSHNELYIPIEVQRPVYLKGWFFALCAFLLLASVWAAIRWRLYRLDKIKQLLEREVAARTDELVRERHTIALQNQELAVLNQTKDHLMAVIGHELRGPMLSIQNIGDSIRYLLKNGQAAQAATLGEHIKHRAFSVRMLLDNLLYWGLSQAGKQEVFREPVPLHTLLVESVELVEFWVSSKKINLSISCPPELTLHTDRNILRMVLLNLLTNAIKFTPEGGTITLRVDPYAQQNYIIEVSDTGIGMEVLPCSDIPLGNFRSTSGTQGEKGTGMGLALCQTLLKSLDGRLAIDSRPEEGSTFRIFLPSQGVVPS